MPLEMIILGKNHLSRSWDVDEGVDVDICKSGHQELAVKSEEKGYALFQSRIFEVLVRNLSMMPPWPGMMSPKSLILNALLNPEAKKPPKGPMMEAKRERKKVWTKKGKKVTVSFMFSNLLHVASVCTSF